MSTAFAFRAPSEAGINFSRNDFDGNVCRGVPQFLEKYFESKTWSASVRSDAQRPKLLQHIRDFPKEILTGHQERALDDWLARLQSLMKTHGRHIYSQTIEEASLNTQTCVYLQSSSTDTSGADVQVFGEFRLNDQETSTDEDRGLLTFFNHAQQLYSEQPTRRFLHAFLVQGAILECWVFDRSGAYSSERLDLKQHPHYLAQILLSYTLMNDVELGFNDFVKRDDFGSCTRIMFTNGKTFHLQSKPIAKPDYIVGPGTTCYAAAESISGSPSMVVKFSWRKNEDHAECKLLEKTFQRHVRGIIQLVTSQDLDNVADLRHGIQFSQVYQNRTLSCVVTTPLGSPLQQFSSVSELLKDLGDIVKALESLYTDGRMLHRDIAIKNIVRQKQQSTSGIGAVLIDLDSALDLDENHSDRSVAGSDGFMAIEILLGHDHNYRHDLESLFYVFLWLAIGNNRTYEHPSIILLDLPETSRLRHWCSRDFSSVARAKAVDMSDEGFPAILDEFSVDFTHLRSLAQKLRQLLFPMRDGTSSSGTDPELGEASRLYLEMYNAFQEYSG